MKKNFFLTAALFAAMCVSAATPATTWDMASLKAASDWTITNLTLNATNSTDSKFSYDNEAGSELKFVPTAVTEQVSITYTNADSKTKCIEVALEQYVQTGGKGYALNLSGLQSGDVITVVAAAKGSTAGNMTATSGCTGADVALPKKEKGAEGADDNGYVWVNATFTASASDVVITENGGGYRFTKILINVSSNINNTIADKGISFNGSNVVNPQGLNITVYNVLGKQIAASNTSINTDDYAKGVYMVRAEGIKGALKFQK